jgi:hemolysin-activating ACP:hemolysin acyltransferase
MSRPWPETVPPAFVTRATLVGFASHVFWRSGTVQNLAWTIPDHVLPALALRQIEFGFDAKGMPESLIAWATVSDEVAAELTENPARRLHMSEWNEGLNLWIVALIAGPRRGAPLLRRLLRGRLAGFERIRGHQRNRDGTIRRFLDRTR